MCRRFIKRGGEEGLVKVQRDMHRDKGGKGQAWKRNVPSDLGKNFDIMLHILYFQGKGRAGNVHTYVRTYPPTPAPHLHRCIQYIHTYTLPVQQHSLSIHSVVPYSVVEC